MLLRWAFLEVASVTALTCVVGTQGGSNERAQHARGLRATLLRIALTDGKAVSWVHLFYHACAGANVSVHARIRTSLYTCVLARASVRLGRIASAICRACYKEHLIWY